MTRLEQNIVQLKKPGFIRGRCGHGRQFGELKAILSRSHLVKRLAEAINVCLHGAGAFRRQVTLGADEGHGAVCLGDQPDVRQLGPAIHEDDVGGFDVAMNQPFPMEVFEGGREREAYLQRFRQ
jgi:hypothetical protein